VRKEVEREKERKGRRGQKREEKQCSPPPLPPLSHSLVASPWEGEETTEASLPIEEEKL